MSFGTILYQILIGPLELFFEVLYTIAYRFIGNYGLTIIVLSIMMNFLVLPLYKRADEMQERERDTEARLHQGISHIKKTFKGDEKMMMLQVYYRQNDYRPLDIIKGSISLFLEIPFFIAAYNFLSGLSCLQGVSFGPIVDLGMPDAMIAIGGIHINVLPILMTATNLVSCIIFTKGSTIKTKVQLYGMALFFFIFLYSSPAGLVFYWTLNNVFSLIKTIFYKLKNPKKVLSIMASFVGVVFLWLGLMQVQVSVKRNVFLVMVGLFLQIPVTLTSLKKKGYINKKREVVKPNGTLFLMGGLFAALFVGILIPSTFIKASPLEYVDFYYFVNPVWYIVSAGCYAVGLFLVWIRVFYWLMNDSGKVLFERTLWAINMVFVLNYMFFGKNLGVISSTLKYEEGMMFDKKELLLNSVAVLVVFVFFVFLLKNFCTKVKGVLFAAVFAVLGMSALNIYGVQTAVLEGLESQKADGENIQLSLSKDGKNVVVIMLDRALGEYIPYIFNEKPELKNQYAGFTYYSNVISFGTSTNFCTPALFGGYEYTPFEINKRADERLVEKQNEAIKVMPVLFDQNDFNVTVCDPTYANYQWIPDLSVYDEYPNIKAYVTNGAFSDPSTKETSVRRNMRNFFCFGVVKAMPLVLQETLYNEGQYNASDKEHEETAYTGQVTNGLSYAEGINEGFMNSYNVLKELPYITSFEENRGSFIIMTNDLTHNPMLLQEPAYTPEIIVDNSTFDVNHTDRFTVDGVTLKMENEMQVTHYQTNMAAIIILGKWLDYLRENDVYDNTRIIIVSDHGRDVGQIEGLYDEEGGPFDYEFYMPLLLVKDFDAKEFSVSDEFMTNADVPTLATQGIIDEPVNPFTGRVITNENKYEQEQYVFGSCEWDVSVNNGNVFRPGMWFSVRDSIKDKSNWSLLQENSISPLEAITE